jgi:hypothetical protein
VRGPVAELPSLLRGVSGIESVFFPEVEDESPFRFWIESGGDEDVRPGVARSLVEAGFELYGIRSESMSLEEVFLKLTTEEEEVE